MPYHHMVFTLPAPVAAIAYQNKAAIYDILFKASAETLTTIGPIAPSPWWRSLPLCAAVPTLENPIVETDSVAGHIGFELRCAERIIHLFEKS